MQPTNMKKYSSSLVIREMQIKTTLRYHLMPVRMAIIKKSGDNRCWRGCGEIGMLLHGQWECQLVQPLWKTVWRSLKDLELEYYLTQQSHYQVYTQRIINHSIIKIHAHMFIVTLFTIAKTWNQSKCPSMIDWIKKMWHMYTMEYYAAIKRMSSCLLQEHE